MKNRVYPVVMATFPTITVEADSKEEALQKAMEDWEGPPSLCHQCAKDVEIGDDPRWHLNDVEELES